MKQIKAFFKSIFWCLWIAGAFFVAWDFFIDESYLVYMGALTVGWMPLFHFVKNYFEPKQ